MARIYRNASVIKKPKEFDPDEFVGSRSISALNGGNFNKFINDRNVSLVMFYDPECAMCNKAKPHIIKAAKTTLREGSGYAAVDCTADPDLCKAELVSSLPSYKLYTKGKLVSEHGKMFDYRDMRKMVENSPMARKYTDPRKLEFHSSK